MKIFDKSKSEKNETVFYYDCRFVCDKLQPGEKKMQYQQIPTPR
jgi:hypothetical protein